MKPSTFVIKINIKPKLREPSTQLNSNQKSRNQKWIDFMKTPFCADF